jgi:hypothetical protein
MFLRRNGFSSLDIDAMDRLDASDEIDAIKELQMTDPDAARSAAKTRKRARYQ